MTIQLALAGFAEFVFHLTRMNPDTMYLHQDSGHMNIAYFKFDIDDQTGKLGNYAFFESCNHHSLSDNHKPPLQQLGPLF